MTRLCEHAGAVDEEFDVCVIWAFVGGRAVRDCVGRGVESKGEDGMGWYWNIISVVALSRDSEIPSNLKNL